MEVQEIGSGYLVYHPERRLQPVGKLKVYHDKFGGNEDPYIWNDKFLHTYCHITQLPNEPGQVNFWVSGDEWPNFNALYCDCVFWIKEKHFWKKRNHIDRNDPIVDNEQSWHHHYKWANEGHHKYKKRRRYTLKAHPDWSFQPQDRKGNLLNILPFLIKNGLSETRLKKNIVTKRGSRPFHLDDELARKLYEYILGTAKTQLKGKQLKPLHPHRKKFAAGDTDGCC